MSNIKSFQTYLSDIRTWLFFFFAVRLIGIMNAPLEIGHSWRQALTNMITRNFIKTAWISFIKDSEKYKLTLEKEVHNFDGKNDLVVINGSQSPQHIYFSNRKGWSETSEVIISNNYIDSVKALGAKVLI